MYDLHKQVFIEMMESRLLQSGDLDSTFGVGGIFNLPASTEPGLILVQKDGRIIKSEGVSVRRLRSGGGADRTYSGNGRATIGISIDAMALQGDGKLILAGNMGIAGEDDRCLTVVRLTKDGEFDTSFADDGYFKLEQYLGSAARSLALRAGRIVVAGDRDYEDGIVVVLNLDGTLDSTFAEDGILEIGESAVVRDVSIARDGAITGVLDRGTGGGTRVFRVDSAGAMDSRYSEDGVSPLVKLDYVSRFIGADGSTVITGIEPSSKAAAFARLTRRGKIDKSFGQAGYQLFTDRPILTLVARENRDGARYVDGILGAPGAENDWRPFVARLTPEYQFDSSFGENGILELPTEGSVTDAAFVPGGDKLLVLAVDYSGPDYLMRVIA